MLVSIIVSMDTAFAEYRHAVVSDYSYLRWAPHYSVILAISGEGLLACCVLKNSHERLNGHSFGQFFDEQRLPAMNP